MLRRIRSFKFDLSKMVSYILTISLVLALIFFPYKVCSANGTIVFPDLTGEWQRKSVYWAVDKGIVHGYEDGTFRPNQKITEAEFAVMIAKSVSGNDLTKANLLGKTQWAQPAYDELSPYGLPLLGYKDPQVKNSPLSRGQAAKIIARIYGFDLNVAEAVDFMYENELCQGSGGRKDFEDYRAFGFLSRAEAVSLISAMDHNSQVTFKGVQSLLSDGRIASEALYCSMDLPVETEMSNSGSYALFQGKTYLNSFADVSLAKEKGRQFANTYLIDQKDKRLLWSNFDREIEFTDSTSQGDLFLINQNYPVANDYKSNNMINMAAYTSKYLRVSDNDMYLDEVAFCPLKSMLNNIYDNGATNLVLLSTYRSYEAQNKLFQSRVNVIKSSVGLENAQKQVAASTAIPGCSEHQTGLAIDFSVNSGLSQLFSNTKEGQWLSNNSWKYGFVVRYANDKMNITGIIYEPWHLRYVGIPHAEIIYKSGFCLEEYLDYIRNEKILQFSDYLGYTHQIYYFDSIHSEDLLSFLYLSNGIQSISGDGKGGVIVTTE
jgi:D-alanyl-D-alanine carboxypeptidase